MADHAAAIRGIPRWHPDTLVRETLSTIRRFGWAVTAVGDGCSCGDSRCAPPDCAFAYTTGLALHSIPDLVVFGLDARTACELLNELGELFHRVDWRSVVDGRTELEVHALEMRVRVIELVDKSDMLITNELFPNHPALQAIWADELGTFPWQTGYVLQPIHQPVKGVPDTGRAHAGGPRVVSASVGGGRVESCRARRRGPRE
ncbi:DUF4262 domain-containing protein [Gordonia oryzae]|uniref:DUF4262 domain-containing protein n=1 Tax=Gordonia oryzae TaxID=2487349 RepID=A0A3N4GIH1_9ACTN|nr:DUF4262 domain-containing protein [Gordonia oryzae]RPA61177.1 DUF4262 domain-containing protein [Gordonia oryzae]